MLFLRASLALAALFILGMTGGCSGKPDKASNLNSASETNANRAVEPGMDGAKDNADELATLVKLPFEPEDLVWKELPNTDKGRRLLAVFQFTSADSKKLIENAIKVRPGTPVTIVSEKWFPKELTTQNEMSGEQGIQATSYAADEFLQPPFTEGTLSRVNDSDFFVLEVFAK